MSEADAHAAALDFVRGVERARLLQLQTVGVRQRPAREPEPHVELVARVYVVGVADVDGDGHAGVRRGAHRERLRLAQLGPLAVNRVPRARLPVGELHEVEGEVAEVPGRAPVADHGGEEGAVLLGAAGVRLALIPDGAADGVGRERREHRVVEDGGAVLVRRARGLRLARPVYLSGGRRRLLFIKPFAVQRDAAARGRVGGREPHLAAAEAAAAHAVEDAHGHGVAPRAHERAGDAVAALRHPRVRRVGADRADALAVEVGRVEVVDGAELQRQVFTRPSRGHFQLPAEPDDAVHVEPGRLPELRQAHPLPGGGVVRGLREALRFALVARVLHDVPPGPLGLRALVLALEPRQVGQLSVVPLQHGFEGGVCGERAAARPRLGGRAAPGGVDESDGHLKTLVQLAAEEVADRRERRGLLRRRDDPAAFHVFERLTGGLLRDGEEVYEGVVGRGRLFRAVLGVGERPLHVRLTRADPDLADEDVLEGERVAPRHGQLEGAARLVRPHVDLPAAARVGDGRRCVPAERDGHALARLGPAPDARLAPLLHDHVVADDRRHAHVGARRAGEGKQQERSRERESVSVDVHRLWESGPYFSRLSVTENN